MEDWVLEKICRAKREHWRFLDLGNAGLEQVPDELLDLTELEVLGLSDWRLMNDPERPEGPEGSGNNGPENRLQTLPAQMARLVRLRVLNLCNSRQVSSLEPLRKLTTLTTLYLCATPIRSVEPLAQLTKLTTLDLTGTWITSAEPLSKLANLTSLNLAQSQITSAEPLSRLANLTSLIVSQTRITSAEPLAQLTNLTTLDLTETPITSAEPLAQLTNLTELFLWNCRLRRFPRRLLALPHIETLSLWGNPFEDCPAEILGAYYYHNCLAAARANFADRDQGAIADLELKLILLGNGRVGKTCVIKRLVHDRFDRDEPSTHGIRLDV